MSDLVTFSRDDEVVTVKRLDSGYFHLRGTGLCNWAQPPNWPCSDEELEESFFHEAGEPFRRSVRAENAHLRSGPCGCKTTCGDVAEADDDPRSVCKGLPVETS